MAKKFINWDNLEYIIESMQKFLIDHNGLDNHLDVFWEARERVTDNMKYGRDITGCTYTKEQYESLINPETSPYLEGTFVGVAEKNKEQDGRLDDIEFGEHSKSDYDNLPYKSIVDIDARDDEQDERMNVIEYGGSGSEYSSGDYEKLQYKSIVSIDRRDSKQDERMGNIEERLNDRYTKKETDDEISEAIVGLENKLLGDDREQIVDTYETLKGIASWIVDHGKDAEALLVAITSLSSRVGELEKNGGGNVDANTIAKINDLRRVLDEIAHVEWNAEAWDNTSKGKLAKPNLTVASKTTNSITVEWDEIVGASSYEVTIQSLNDSYAYTENQTFEFGTNTYTFDECGPGVEYSISIRAIDDSGMYEDSDICNITTLTYVLKLSTPDISLSTLGDTSVHIKWHREPNASSYEIGLDDGDSYIEGNINVNEDVLYCIFNDISIGHPYTIKAIAKDDSGKCEASELLSIDFTLTKLDTPQVRLIEDGDSVTLSWFEVENAEWYHIVQNGLDVDSINGTSYKFENLEPSVIYRFGVQALAGGPYVCSNMATVEYTCPEAEIPTPDITKLAAPLFEIIDITDNSLDLDWEAVQFAERYKIYLDDEELGTTDRTSYTITDLAPGTKYIIGVQSIDDDSVYEDSDIFTQEASTNIGEDHETGGETEDIGVDDVTKMTFEGGGLEDPGTNINNTLDEALEDA